MVLGDRRGEGSRESSASSVLALSSFSSQAGRALTGGLASDIPQGWCEQVTFAYLHLGTGDTASNRCTDKRLEHYFYRQETV